MHIALNLTNKQKSYEKKFLLRKDGIILCGMTGGVIKSNAQCSAVTSMTPGAVTCSTATVTWTPVTGAMGYEYVLDNSTMDPSGMGLMAMSNSSTAMGLTASTTYQVHVRAMCMSGYSAWATLGTVTTPACAIPCTAPASVTATPTSHSVSISWPASTGAIGYEYVVNTTTVNPTTTGTLTATTTATVNGLTAATTYYVHARTKCGASTYSPWATAHSFSTSAATAVANINGNGEVALNVFPNPFQNKLTVEVMGGISKQSELHVLSPDGKVVKTMSINNESSVIDLGDLSNGLYFVRYSDGAYTQTVKVNKY